MTACSSIGRMRKSLFTDRRLPACEEVKAVHVYDFDNTLFRCPTPNQKLWTPDSVNFLYEEHMLKGGGWWHDKSILESTGEGMEMEETRAWEGWWNEDVVELVKLSTQEPGVLTVLMTGRGRERFEAVISRILTSRELEFDLIALKDSPLQKTLNYKYEAVEEILRNFQYIEELRIRHIRSFRDFASKLVTRMKQERPDIPLEVAVVQVPPGMERRLVENMLERHNRDPGTLPLRKILRTVAYTGYILEPAMTSRLLSMFSLPSPASGDIHYYGDHLHIVPRAAPDYVLDHVGGLGACVSPNMKVYTVFPQPCLVLAIATNLGGTTLDAGQIKNWIDLPPEKRVTFRTRVGERAQLTIDIPKGNFQFKNGSTSHFQKKNR